MSGGAACDGTGLSWVLRTLPTADLAVEPYPTRTARPVTSVDRHPARRCQRIPAAVVDRHPAEPASEVRREAVGCVLHGR
ncbi:hypothetical protein [Micromonospora sp. ATCC 39149]|uniref:Uncharacterized protein n=1 Tax=Micromonospora carbonacea TaxID=47853 RepID=A0A7D6CA63_9ACTN|nr:hypothetical protein [Micromonospora sp. ATCC 39149]QLJ98102.1 hypothetical protein HZU44_25800 [Micromonospora carbonacea]